MAKKFLDFSGLTAYDVRIKNFISGSTKEVSDALDNEITRAKQMEMSILATFSAITEVNYGSGQTNATSIFLPSETADLYGNSVNVNDALKYSAPDSTLSNLGRSAEAKVTGDKIRRLESQMNNYTIAKAMSEEDYLNLISKDNNTIYILYEE